MPKSLVKVQPNTVPPKRRAEHVTVPALTSIRLVKPAERKMRMYSASRLEDLATCPTYGLVHNKRRYATQARAMALDAGGVMHQVFAATRIWQLLNQQRLPDHARVTAERVFGLERWNECAPDKGKFQPLSRKTTDDAMRDDLLTLCFAILHSSGYYDDPDDEIRTIANMELATLRYIDDRLPSMTNWPIYVADERDPHSLVGVEQVFDVALVYADGKTLRYIGTIDGLVRSIGHNRVFLDENKTAARLDDAWRLSFDMRAQITGYMACTTALFNVSVLDARIHGLRFKIYNKHEDSAVLEVKRTPEALIKWGQDVRWAAETLDEPYNTSEIGSEDASESAPDFENAPRFTHSCNRYFRPCSLITFCADTAQGRREQWEQMVPAPPSPSVRAVLEMQQKMQQKKDGNRG